MSVKIESTDNIFETTDVSVLCDSLENEQFFELLKTTSSDLVLVKKTISNLLNVFLHFIQSRFLILKFGLIRF